MSKHPPFQPSAIFAQRLAEGVDGPSVDRYLSDPVFRDKVKVAGILAVTNKAAVLRFAVDDFKTAPGQTHDMIWSGFKRAIYSLLAALHHSGDLYGAGLLIPVPRTVFPTSDPSLTIQLDPELIADQTVWTDAVAEADVMFEALSAKRFITMRGFMFTRSNNLGSATFTWENMCRARLGEFVRCHLLTEFLEATKRVEMMEEAYSEVADSDDITAEVLIGMQEDLFLTQGHRNVLESILRQFAEIQQKIEAELSKATK